MADGAGGQTRGGCFGAGASKSFSPLLLRHTAALSPMAPNERFVRHSGSDWGVGGGQCVTNTGGGSNDRHCWASNMISWSWDANESRACGWPISVEFPLLDDGLTASPMISEDFGHDDEQLDSVEPKEFLAVEDRPGNAVGNSVEPEDVEVAASGDALNEVTSHDAGIRKSNSQRHKKIKRKKRPSMSSSSLMASDSSIVKGQWTPEEDSLLLRLVKEHGVKRWSKIADLMVCRVGKQCRERWNNHLRPDIKKDTWSEEEERLLVEAHERFGNKWVEIAKSIPGRAENSIKNHWNAARRKELHERRNYKNKVDSDTASNKRNRATSGFPSATTSSRKKAKIVAATARKDLEEKQKHQMSVSNGVRDHIGNQSVNPGPLSSISTLTNNSGEPSSTPLARMFEQDTSALNYAACAVNPLAEVCGHPKTSTSVMHYKDQPSEDYSNVDHQHDCSAHYYYQFPGCPYAKNDTTQLLTAMHPAQQLHVQPDHTSSYTTDETLGYSYETLDGTPTCSSDAYAGCACSLIPAKDDIVKKQQQPLQPSPTVVLDGIQYRGDLDLVEMMSMF